MPRKKTSRRSHGEGTIRERDVKRRDGSTYKRYNAIITLGFNPTSGRQERLEGPSRETRKEAGKDLTELRTKRDNGILTSHENAPLAAYLDYWLEQSEPTLKPSSIRSYQSDVDLHIKPHLGRHKLGKLKPIHVQAWQTKVLNSTSPHVTRKARACLSAALRQAVRWQLIPLNPLDAVATVRVPKADRTYWEPTEIRSFITEALEHRYYPLYYLTIMSGLRLGEVRGLQWGDIEGNRLHVSRQVLADRREPEYGPPKTPHSDRLIPLPADVLQVLGRHRMEQEKTREKAGANWEDHGLVFTTRYGTPPPSNRIRQGMKAVAARAKLSELRFHDLRHMYASLMIAKGVDAPTLATYLGHSDPTTTLRIYAHAFKAQLERHSYSLEELLGEG